MVIDLLYREAEAACLWTDYLNISHDARFFGLSIKLFYPKMIWFAGHPWMLWIAKAWPEWAVL